MNRLSITSSADLRTDKVVQSKNTLFPSNNNMRRQTVAYNIKVEPNLNNLFTFNQDIRRNSMMTSDDLVANEVMKNVKENSKSMRVNKTTVFDFV